MMKRRSESGNIFFMLFGAVALVGVVAAATSSVMRGPLSTVVNVNSRAKADTQMQIAAKLAMVRAAQQPLSGDCDADGNIEPIPATDASPKPVGGGQLPASIGASQQDPWGDAYGYCVWDIGTKNADGACAAGAGEVTRLKGDYNNNYPVMVIVSAGPDRTFQTQCNDWVTTNPGSDPVSNNYPTNFVGSLTGQHATAQAGDVIYKPTASDDIILSYTYDQASQVAGGLWSLTKTDPNKITTNKDVDIQTNANFASGKTATFQGAAQFDSGARLDLGFGRAGADSGGLFKLPDDTSLTSCNVANDGALRLKITGTHNALQVCDGKVGGTGWTDPSASGLSVSKIDDLTDAIASFSSQSKNIMLGDGTGLNFTSTSAGLRNVMLGVGSATGLGATNSDNVIIGSNTATSLTGGSQNIVVGSNINVPSATQNGFMSIGNLIYATGMNGSGTTVSAGNVGIGIAAPGAKFDVAGTIQGTQFQFNSSNALSLSGGNITLSYSGNNQLYVNGNGLGVGAAPTHSPSTGKSNLDVNGDAYADRFIAYGSAAAFTFAGDVDTGISHPGGSMVGIMVGNAEKARFTASGLGINTTSPNAALDVIGEGSFSGYVTSPLGFRFDSSGSGGGVFNNSGNVAVKVGGGSTAATFTSSGLGVGLTNPQVSLDVSGAIRPGNMTVCSTLLAGAIRFSSDTLEYCSTDGNWYSLFTAGGGGGGSNLWTNNTTYISRVNAHFINSATALPAALSSAGDRFFWYPNKSSFRAGGTSGATQWSDANIGAYSIGLGFDAQASGAESFAAGNATTAGGTSSVALGQGANAGGANSMAIGLGAPAGTAPVVSGARSLGIFMGDQSGKNITSNNTMELLGGKFLIDANPLFASSTTIGGSLTLDVNGNAGADQYCDSDGAYCFTAQSISSGSAFVFENAANVIRLTSGTVNYSSASFVFGSPQLADDGVAGHRNRFYYDKSSGAFRAGGTSGTLWDSVGAYSMGFGYDTNASGNYSLAAGRLSNATNMQSVALGYGVNSSGDSSVGMGSLTTASGNYSVALGNKATASGLESFAFGLGDPASNPIVSGAHSLGVFMGDQGGVNFASGNTFGIFGGNMVIDPKTPATQLTARGVLDLGAATDAMVMPTGTTAQKPTGAAAVNGMIRYNTDNGKFEAYQAGAWQDILTSAVAGGAAAPDRGIQFNSGNNFSASNNLLYTSAGDLLVAGTYTGTAVPPATGAGTRMFFDPGSAAFRAGNAGSTQWDAVNIGTYSAAFGANATASGSASMALGTGVTASGFAGVAMGSATTASGNGSTAIGDTTTASGYAGFAAGYLAKASGGNSIALGRKVVAGNGTAGSGFGDYSIAFGLGDSSTAAYPQVNGTSSVGLFLGDQHGVVFASSNTMGLFGGKFVIDPAAPATYLAARTALDVNGSIKISDGGETCAATLKGAIRYTSANTLQYCNGTAWTSTAAGTGVMAIDDLSDAITQYASGGSMYLGSGVGAAGTGGGNTALGTNAMATGVNASQNTAFGYEAMRYANSTSSATPTYNTAVGYQALRGSTSAAANTGANNTAIGNNALFSNTSGVFNVAVGASALPNNTTGGSNTAIGTSALGANVSGDGNTAFGNFALGHTTGTGNIGVGNNAGQNITTGNGNIIIGNVINASSATGNYQLNIGDFITGDMGAGLAYISSNGAIMLPTGTTGQRPLAASTVNGMIRYNTGTGKFEAYQGGSWQDIITTGSGALSAGSDRQIIFNSGGTLTGAATMLFTSSNGVSIGSSATSTGSNAVALGYQAQATGLYSIAFGSASSTNASTVAMGSGAVASGQAAIGIGVNASATGQYALALGTSSIASNLSAVAIGNNSTAFRSNSVAIGYYNSSNGDYSTALGFRTTASGNYSTSLGVRATAGNGTYGSGYGNFSTAIGFNSAAGTPPQVRGTGSLGLFMQDQSGVQFASDNTMGLFGGKFVIDPAAPATYLTAQTALDVNGSIKISDGGETCSTTVKGAIRYTSGNVLEYCNGTAWTSTAAGTGVMAIDDLSDAITQYTSGSMYLGSGSGATASGASNTALGYQALKSVTSGTLDTAVGSQALYSNTTGSWNNAFGYQALYSNTTGIINDAFGYKALTANTTGGGNLAFGYASLLSNTTGSQNVAIGQQALQLSSSGGSNTGVGSYALNGNTTGDNNTALGRQALLANTTGISNTALGHTALVAETTGSNNVAVGYAAGSNLTSGSSNIAIGASVTFGSATGSNQLNIGNLITGNMSTGLAYISSNGAVMLPTGTTGQRPVAASTVNGMIRYNTGSGKFEGYQGGAWQDILTSGGGTMAIDDLSDAITKYSSGNMYLGSGVGASATTAALNNTFLGSGVAQAVVSGSTNTGFGALSLASLTSGISNTAVGYMALNKVTTGAWNSAFGNGALANVTNGADNHGFGDGTLGNTTTGSENDAFGDYVLNSNTVGNNNVGIGGTALQTNVAMSESTAIGYSAMARANSTSTASVSYNTAVGAYALQGGATPSANTGTANTALGHSAMMVNTSGVDNTGVGAGAFGNNTTGSSGVAVGRLAAASNTTGIQNVALGASTFYTNTTGYGNTALGYSALYGNTSGNSNVAVGGNALYAVTTGSGNIGFGSASGANITSGSNNIMLGTNISAQSATGSNQLSIGNLIFGSGGMGTGTTVGTGFVGIRTATPRVSLDIVGTDAIMIPAGNNSTNRPTGSNLANGMIRYNTTDTRFEGYQNGSWLPFSSAATGAIGAIDDLTDAITQYSSGSMYLGSGVGTVATGGGNTALGYNALSTNVGAQWNTAIGFEAMRYANDTGFATNARNTAIGYRALRGSTTASANTGTFNTAIGYNAMLNNTTGATNAAFGTDTLAANTTGSNNAAFGAEALASNTTGGQNTAFGPYALNANTVASLNTAIGANALLTNVAKMESTAIGFNAMRYADDTAVTSSTYNFAIGNYALQGSVTPANNTGINNTALGYASLLVNTSGSGNMAIGQYALSANTTGNNNIAIGFHGGDAITTGSNNILIGYDIDAQSATANSQMSLGNLIFASGGFGTGTTVGTGRVGIRTATPRVTLDIVGTDAAMLPAGTTAQQPSSSVNGMIRYNSDKAAFEGFQNGAWVAFVSGSGGVASAAGTNTQVQFNSGGSLAATSNFTWTDSTGMLSVSKGYQFGGSTVFTYPKAAADTSGLAIGVSALASQTANTGYNIGVGYQAGQSVTSSGKNALMGYQAGQYISTGSENVAVGYTALQGVSGTPQTGGFNTAIGSGALSLMQGAAANNTGIGEYAGLNISSGYDNTAIGGESMQGVSGSKLTGAENTSLGYQAGYKIQGAASNDTYLGSNSAKNATTGSNNVVLGYNGANTLTTGSNNLVLGYNVDVPTATTSNYMSVGNLLFGSGGLGTGTTVGSGLVGIKTATPRVTLDISGTDAVMVPAGTTAQRPGATTAANGMIRYNSSNGYFEGYQAGLWLAFMSSGASGSAALSSITAATTTNTIANANNAQTWNWDTLTTETAMSIGSTSMTTGSLLNITDSNNNAASTGSVVNITASGASNAAVPLAVTNAGTGLSFRVNDDGTTTDSSPFAIDANGNVGVGVVPSYGVEIKKDSMFFHDTGTYVYLWATQGKINIGGSATPIAGLDVTTPVTAAGASGMGTRFSQQLNAAANNDVLAAVTVTPSWNDSSFTGVKHYGLVVGSGNVGFGTTTPRSSLDINTTDAMIVPAGTTAQQPTGINGMIRYNTSSANFEGYQNGAWLAFASAGAGGTAASPDRGIQFNSGNAFTASSNLTYSSVGALLASGTYTGGSVFPASGAGTRMFFDPAKSVFRAGTVSGNVWNFASAGAYSTAFGQDTIASASYTFATGFQAEASGMYSTAMGYVTKASGIGSVAGGFNAWATGNYSTAFGDQPLASGQNSVALGNFANATNTSSTAMGDHTLASGAGSTAIGYYTTASGIRGTALGDTTTASGLDSTAMGYNTTASGWYSTAMGFNVFSSANYAMAMGLGSFASAPKVTGDGSYGIFMGAQTNAVLLSATNTMGLFGGKFVIDPNAPATQLSARGVLDMGAATDAVVLPIGTTAQQPGTPVNGMIRYNTTKLAFEGYQNGAWLAFASTGGGVVLAIDDLTDAITRYASSNMYLGTNVGASTTSGQQNTALGASAMAAVTSGVDNSAFGYNALNAVTSGTYNVAVGSQTLTANTGGGYNTAVGHAALWSATGSSNTSVGAYSAANTGGGANNTAMGSYALNTNNAKNESTAIGFNAMAYADSTAVSAVTYNTALGAYALQGSTTAANNTGTRNTALGHSALASNTSGSSNVAIGPQAMNLAATRSSTIAIGDNAAYNVAGDGNIAIGSYSLAGSSGAGGTSNVAVGNQAMRYNVGNYNVAIGGASGMQTIGNYNVFVGDTSGPNAGTSTYSNVGVGYAAMTELTTASNNTGSGYMAMRYMTTGGGNTAYGQTALMNISTGSGNIGVGSGVGTTLTTGSGNILFGSAVDVPAAATSNYMSIGNLIFGSGGFGTGTTVGTGRIGIKTASPRVTMDVVGTDAIMLPAGNNSTNRPTGSNLANGMVRYNTTDNRFEGYQNNSWLPFSSGGAGSATSLNGITAATASQAGIDSTNNSIVWNWSTFTSGSAMTLANTSTAANANTTLNVTNATTGTGSAIVGTNTGVGSGAGVKGVSASGGGYGIWGVNSSTNSNGVAIYAQQTATSGDVTGLYASIASSSDGGSAIWAESLAATGATAGVYGDVASNSTGAAGVVGATGANNGKTYGVMGTNGSGTTAAAAVYGNQWSTSGTVYGVYGTSASPSGYGGYFDNSGTNGVAMYVSGGGAVNSAAVFVGNAITLPGSATRPSTPVNGMIRYNTTSKNFEGYQNNSWLPFVSTSSGGAIAIDDLTDAITQYASGGSMYLGSGVGGSGTGGANTVLGYNAYNTGVAAQQSTAIGYEAMRYANSTASATITYNTALGYQALRGSTTASANTGVQNTAIGSGALMVNTTGGTNVSVGDGSMSNNTTGGSNVAVGSYAMQANTTGRDNTYMGNVVGWDTSTGSNNTAIGSQALYRNKGKQESTAIGYKAMYNADSSTSNVVTYNTAIGSYALYSGGTPASNTGTNNTAIGHSSMLVTTTGAFNAALGSNTLQANTTGSNNTAAGDAALYSLTTGSGNSVVGSEALGLGTTGGNNTAMGFRALKYNAGKMESTAIGYYAMFNANNSASNVVSYNTALGAYALQGSATAASNTGTSNTAIGHSAMIGTTSGASNTAIGAGSLLVLTTGSNNLAFGSSAGDNITTGSSNIIIGANIDAQVATASNQMSIGNLIFASGGFGTGTTAGTGRVGIKATAPRVSLDIVGTDAIMVPSGNNSTDRPTGSNLANGMMRYNATDTRFEGYQNGSWLPFSSGGGSGSGTPAGSNLQVQINNGGAFGASSGLTFNSSTNTLTVGSAVNITGTTGLTAPTGMGIVNLSDVSISSPTTGQLLTYNGTNWVNGSAAGLSLAIDDLTDAITQYASGGSMYLGSGSGASGTGGTNTALGTNAMATVVNTNGSTAFGYEAMRYANSSASATSTGNSAFGSGALRGSTTASANTGTGNTAIGANAMASNTTGFSNVAVGTNSMTASTTANGNTAIGLSTLVNTTTGGGNTALGYAALLGNVGKQESTAVGYQAMLYGNGSASNGATFNTAVGAYALQGSTTPTNNTGTSNTAVGHTSMIAVTSGSGNTAVGALTLSVLTTGSNNLAFGSAAGANITTGSSNIIIGTGISAQVATASNQMSIGNLIFASGGFGTGTTAGTGRVGIKATAPRVSLDVVGTDAIMVPSGNNSTDRPTGSNLANGMIRYNTTDTRFEGYQNGAWLPFSSGGSVATIALDNLTDAKTDYVIDNNLLIGTPGDAYAIAATGTYNLALGQLAGDSITTGDHNIAIGYNALTTVTTAGYNTAIGKDALMSSTTGVDNTAIGDNASSASTVAYGNVGIGNNTLATNVRKSRNTAVGASAMQYTNSAAVAVDTDNTAIGWSALQGSSTPANNTGVNNTAVGSAALGITTSGTDNTAVGLAMRANTTGNNNVAVGNWALGGNTIGYSNTAVGWQALLGNKAGRESTAFGFNALQYANDTTTGSTTFNTAVGAYALRGSTTAASNTGIDNTAIGHSAMLAATSGYDNTAVGVGAMQNITTGFYNTAVGSNALSNAGTSSFSVAVGYAALSGSTGGYSNALGYRALRIAQGTMNNAIGYMAMDNTTVGNSNNVMGYQAALSNVGGSEIIAIGHAAMQNANSAAAAFSPMNTAIGTYALRGSGTASANTGTSNTVIGYQTMQNNTTGTSNVALGDGTLVNNTTGSRNVAIGAGNGSTLAPLLTSSIGNDSTAVGYSALALSTGNSNTALGSGAGDNITSGSSNIIIGVNVDAQVATASNQMSIGNLIFASGGFGTGTTAGTGRVGIKATAPRVSLDVVGTDAIMVPSGNNSTDRPTGSNLANGMIRYNATNTRFEGYQNNSWLPFVSSSSSAPAGSTTQVQFNSGGAMGATSNLTWDNTNKYLAINTASPNSNIHVTATGFNAMRLQNSPGMDVYADLMTSDAYDVHWRFSTAGVSQYNVGVKNSDGTFRVGAANDFSNTLLTLDSSGNLTVKNNISYAGVLTDTSDRRLKTDIHPLMDKGSMLDKINKIDTYTYRLKKEGSFVQYGVMAQELKNIFPELVFTDTKTKENYMSVNYTGLIAPLIESTKELKAQNDNLKSRVAELEQQQKETHADIESLSRDIKGMKAYTGYGIDRAGMDGWMMLLMGIVFGGGGMAFAYKSGFRVRRQK